MELEHQYQHQQSQHFYQKFPTWVAISFLSGATAMVAVFILLTTGSAAPVGQLAYGPTNRPSPSNPPFISLNNQPTSIATQADNGSAASLSGVTITQPVEGEAVSFQGVVTVRASARAVNGVKNMVILIDDQLAKSCTGSSCSIVVSASGLPSGYFHTVQAIATSIDGNSASAVRHFSVVAQ